MASSSSQKHWEAANRVQAASDDLYRYDEREQKDIRNAKPWEKDAQYFKEVRVSALALLKMVMHTRSGGNIEVMGMMLGKLDAHTLIVMDSFALPVEGTETRVNAQQEAYEYMSQYVHLNEQSTRKEKVVGWYHSHPGYGCWLSGIDVATQQLNQQYQDPFVAIVIDPIRTMSAGKVEMGAFRTYPKGFKPPDNQNSDYQPIPLHKIEDFGVHANEYYKLDISYFKSSLDNKLLSTLWNSYWMNTLSTSPLINNLAFTTAQTSDLGDKLRNEASRLDDAIDLTARDAPSWGSKGARSAIDQKRLQDAINESDRLAVDNADALLTHALKKAITDDSSGFKHTFDDTIDKLVALRD